jgi:iron-sulfur cluster assembly protein
MAVTLTESAAKYVAGTLNRRGKGVGLRLAVRTSGCSGYAYKIDFADELKEGDACFESHGVKVVVDPQSLVFLEGTEVDFLKDGLNERLTFRNPNVKDECGCGESFAV